MGGVTKVKVMFDWFSKRHSDLPEPCWSAGPSGMLITSQDGFLSGTHVVSNLGWRAVESLCVGDKVLTFDNGMRTIADIQRETLNNGERTVPRVQWPMLVPEGVLQNRCEMHVMPDQGMFIETDLVSDGFGEPYAVLPARALEGFRGITQVEPDHGLTLTTLAFRQDEVVYAEGGMLIHCPCAREMLSHETQQLEAYLVLNTAEARELVQRMIAQDEGQTMGWMPEEIEIYRPNRTMRPE
ncbi:MAG: hypothetical protein GJ676_16930 [Rhodobacteraceae bacterium]|nr:hypothetical protein [Paracoccaceae bacterium]